MLAALPLSLPAFAALPASASSDDLRFIARIVAGSRMQAALARVTLQRSHDPDVRALAHEQIAQTGRLVGALRASGAAPTSLEPLAPSDDAGQEGIGAVARDSDPQLRHDYFARVRSNQRWLIGVLEREGRDGRNPALRHFADEQLAPARATLARATSALRQ